MYGNLIPIFNVSFRRKTQKHITMKLQLKFSEDLFKRLERFKKYGYNLTVYKKSECIYLNTNSDLILRSIKKSDIIPNEYNLYSILENNLGMKGKYLIPTYY